MGARGGARAVVLAPLILLASVAAGCGGGGVDPSSLDGQRLRAEGFGCRTMTVTADDGSASEACVWVADTAELRQRGLMGVADPGLGGRAAMVFTFDEPVTVGFWMKDTLVPLTVVWVDADGRVIGGRDMEPCPDPTGATCPTASPPGRYAMAVEVPRGAAPALGLVPGATVTLGEPC